MLSDVLHAKQRPWEGRKSGQLCGQVVEFMSVYGIFRAPLLASRSNSRKPACAVLLKQILFHIDFVNGNLMRRLHIFNFWKKADTNGASAEKKITQLCFVAIMAW